ncbi:hypothetical protein, partial [Endozoicomonas sp. SESOKO4]|uniref:hypothetical protein n=1 Tax=Endozoicomonas sp. SESOKO4 TaxID=2828745 RepID=UPI0021498499
DGQQRQLVYRSKAASYERLAFKLLINNSSGEVRLVRTDADSGTDRLVLNLDKAALIKPQVSPFLQNPQNIKTTEVVSSGEDQRFSLVRMKDSGQYGILLQNTKSAGQQPDVNSAPKTVRIVPFAETTTVRHIQDAIAVDSELNPTTGQPKKGWLFTASDPELRFILFHLPAGLADQKVDGLRIVKKMHHSLELFFKSTDEGKALKTRLESLATELARPVSLSDLPQVSQAADGKISRLIPGQARVLLTLDTTISQNNRLERYQGQNGFVTIKIDPSTIRQGAEVSDSTQLFPRLASIFPELLPASGELEYENRIRESLGLPAIEQKTSDAIARGDEQLVVRSIEVAGGLRLTIDEQGAYDQFNRQVVVAEMPPGKDGKPYARLVMDTVDSLRLEISDPESFKAVSGLEVATIRELLTKTLRDDQANGRYLVQNLERVNQQLMELNSGKPLRFKAVNNELIEKIKTSLPDFIDAKPTSPKGSPVNHRVFVNLQSWGSPLSGLNRLMPSESVQRFLAKCRLEAEQLALRYMPVGSQHRSYIKSLFTNFLFQSITKIARQVTPDVSTGFMPLTGVSDAVAGELPQNAAIELSETLKKKGFDAFTAAVKASARRITDFANIDKNVLRGHLFDKSVYSVFAETLSLRISKGEAFQLPVEPMSLSPRNGLRVIDPVAISEGQRQPLVKSGDRVFGMVSVDTERVASWQNLGSGEVDGLLQLTRQSGIGRTDSETLAFIKNLEAIFSDVSDPPPSLSEDIAKRVGELGTSDRNRLGQALIDRVSDEQKTGIVADPGQWQARSELAGELLKLELNDIAGQIAADERLDDVQCRRVDRLSTLTDVVTLPLDVRGSRVEVELNPTLTLDASWVDTRQNRMVIGTTMTQGLVAVGALTLFKVLDKAIAGEHTGGDLVALGVRNNSEGLAINDPGRVRVMPARLDVVAKLDRLATAADLVKELDAVDTGADIARSLRQGISNSVDLLQTLSGDESNWNIAGEPFRKRLNAFSRTLNLPEPDLPKVVCRRAAGDSCGRSVIQTLDLVDDELDKTLTSRELESLKQQLRASGTEGKAAELLKTINLFANQRFAAVSAVSPADDSKLQRKVMTELVQLLSAGKAASVEGAMDRVLEIYSKAGFEEDIGDLKEAIRGSDEFKAIVDSMVDQKGSHESSDALKQAGALRENMIDRWLRKKGVDQSPTLKKFQNFQAKLAAKSWFGPAQMGLGVGMGISGLAQSSVSLYNLNKFRDSLSPETYAMGITGV